MIWVKVCYVPLTVLGSSIFLVYVDFMWLVLSGGRVGILWRVHVCLYMYMVAERLRCNSFWSRNWWKLVCRSSRYKKSLNSHPETTETIGRLSVCWQEKEASVIHRILPWFIDVQVSSLLKMDLVAVSISQIKILSLNSCPQLILWSRLCIEQVSTWSDKLVHTPNNPELRNWSVMSMNRLLALCEGYQVLLIRFVMEQDLLGFWKIYTNALRSSLSCLPCFAI